MLPLLPRCIPALALVLVLPRSAVVARASRLGEGDLLLRMLGLWGWGCSTRTTVSPFSALLALALVLATGALSSGSGSGLVLARDGLRAAEKLREGLIPALALDEAGGEALPPSSGESNPPF